MGHKYEHLLEGAIKEDETVVDTTAIAAANAHVQETLKLMARRILTRKRNWVLAGI